MTEAYLSPAPNTSVAGLKTSAIPTGPCKTGFMAYAWHIMVFSVAMLLFLQLIPQDSDTPGTEFPSRYSSSCNHDLSLELCQIDLNVGAIDEECPRPTLGSPHNMLNPAQKARWERTFELRLGE